MARTPKPVPFRGWYTTEAGGQGRVKLCPIEDGLEAAQAKLAEHLASLAPPPPAPDGRLTVGQFCDRFMRHAEIYYRLPSGKPSKEVVEYERSFRELRTLYTSVAVEDFAKRDLKAVREAMIAAGLSRGVVNQRVGRIVRAFRWGAEEEHVPDAVAAALVLVQPLKQGRSTAHETEDVPPVAIEVVEATLKEVGTAVGLMIRLQLLTGMRPGEVCELKRSQVLTDGEPWRLHFGTTQHKMGYKGKSKTLVVGPKAREILRDLIAFNGEKAGEDWYFFRPQEASKSKKTRFLPCYSVQAYGTAIERACRRAGVEAWTPGQLRHTYATEVRRRFGLEAAQVMLGHGRADVTQVYAERDLKAAERVAAEMG